MYNAADGKFIKFLNKEEKKAYGFGLGENLRAQYGHKPVVLGTEESGQVSDELPWD
jgi:hypothetical protein